MKLRAYVLGAAGAALALAAAAAASADTIDFGQFGPDHSSLPNTVAGVTTGGVSFTLSGPGYKFLVVHQTTSWSGGFPTGAPVLFDYMPGAITLDFATPITSLTGLTIDPNLPGTFTATANYYDGATLVGSSSFTNPGDRIPDTLPSFNIAGPGITKIVVSTDLDYIGVGIGSGGVVPEPTTWATLIIGVLMIGFAARRRNAGLAPAA